MIGASTLPEVELGGARPFRVYLPVLLSGDLVQSAEHLGPAYLAAVLRNAGAEVRIRTLPGIHPAHWHEDILKFAPDLVGLSLTMVANADAQAFGAMLRQSLPNTPIVGGGPLATHLGEALLRTPGWDFFDGLVRGEGEAPILMLADALKHGHELSTVGSLVYRSDDRVIANPVTLGVGNLDLLPPPARDQFLESGNALPYLRISTSRGCTSHCTFCNAPHVRNRVGSATKPWRGASPGKIVDEIEDLVRRYGVNTFDFVDSTFEDPGGGKIGKARIAAIAEGLLDRGISIYYNACMQAANWNEGDRDLLNLLWRSGLEKVLVGIESGSDLGLARWQKKSTVADNVRIIRLLREANVYVAFGFIAFHPWITLEEYESNILFLRDSFGHNLRRFTTRLELYPGSEVIGQLQQDGLLDQSYTENLNIYGYRWVDERLERIANTLNGLYGTEYAETGKIDREPAVFRFETFDITTHNFSSRLARALQDHRTGSAILREFDVETEEIRKELADFNFALISDIIESTRAGHLDTAAVHARAPEIETVFSQAMARIERLKLIAGMNLRRAGIDTRNILFKTSVAEVA
ncbi:radical SAM protein [Sphingomonas sp. DG1-23]|uniref:B12-binding domain-containing radical SAM protein n=1 Tax=Sphingomonas sp. DG1-23 TaxID=3068316 RepID=UPI00274013DA|nr:radical SAM protein [Sphingomonas sp. DG1-23]MDP5278669.1 radical SAM protein [Sphingomonas sp. DG1-23]